MNYLLLTSGIVATLATIGHFTIGNKDFLKPVINSKVDEIPKNVMQSLFHYMSVYMVLTSVILLAFSTGNQLIFENPTDIVKVIGFVYAGYAIVQFIIALSSKVDKGVFKMFQRVFWTLIAVFSLLSAY